MGASPSPCYGTGRNNPRAPKPPQIFSLQYPGAPEHTMATAHACNLSWARDANGANTFEKTALITLPASCEDNWNKGRSPSCPIPTSTSHDPKMTSARRYITQGSIIRRCSKLEQLQGKLASSPSGRQVVNSTRRDVSSNRVEVGGYRGQRGGERGVNRRGGDRDFKENTDWRGGTVVMQRPPRDGGGGCRKRYAAADAVKPTYSQIKAAKRGFK